MERSPKHELANARKAVKKGLSVISRASDAEIRIALCGIPVGKVLSDLCREIDSLSISMSDYCPDFRTMREEANSMAARKIPDTMHTFCSSLQKNQQGKDFQVDLLATIERIYKMRAIAMMVVCRYDLLAEQKKREVSLEKYAKRREVIMRLKDFFHVQLLTVLYSFKSFLP